MFNEIIIGIIICVIVSIIALQFLSLKQWLLYAVSEAEQYFGSGTGQLKLHYVYNLAVEGKFSFITKFITFNLFSKLVDVALKKLEKIIENSDSIANVIQARKFLDITEEKKTSISDTTKIEN